MVVLTVLSLASAILGGSLIALRTTQLSVASGEFADFVNLCRSHAIAKHTAVRVGVVTSSTGTQDELYRSYSAWEWSRKSRKYEQFASWESLPKTAVFEPGAPEYIRDAEYFAKDPSSTRGDHLLSLDDNQFEVEDGSGTLRTLKFVEFSPAGRAAAPGGELRNLVLVVREGTADEPPAEVANWCQFNVDTLTGRIRVHRP